MYSTVLTAPGGSNTRPTPIPPLFQTLPSPLSNSINLWGADVRRLITLDGTGPSLVTGGFDWTSIDWTSELPADGHPLKVGGILTLGTDIFNFTDTAQATVPITLTVGYFLILVDGGGFKCFFTIQPTVSFLSLGALPITADATHTTDGYNGYSTADSLAGSDGSSLTLVVGATDALGPRCGMGTFYIDRTRNGAGAADGRGAICGYSGSYGYTLDPGIFNKKGNAKRGHTYVLDLEVIGIDQQGGAGLLEGYHAAGFLPAVFATGTRTGDAMNLVVPHTVVGHDQQLSASFNLLTTFDEVSTGDTVTVTGRGGTYYALGAFCNCSEPPPGLPPATVLVLQ